jgi:uncharacterized protein
MGSGKGREKHRKHKVDFSTACRIWEGSILERGDNRRDYGEVRIEASGKVDGRLMVVIFTWRGAVRRIISARKANAREKRRFEANFVRRSQAPQN